MINDIGKFDIPIIKYNKEASKIHLRVEKNKRKTRSYITYITNIENINYDLQKLIKILRKELHCGCNIDNKKYGTSIKLQGHDNNKIINILLKEKIINSKDDIELHGI